MLIDSIRRRSLILIGVVLIVVVVILAILFGLACGGGGDNGDAGEPTVMPTPVVESTDGDSILEVQTIDRDSGDPILGAKIILTIGVQDGFLAHEEQRTDDKGRAIFTGLTEGLYDVSARASGYDMAVEMDVVVEGRISLTLEMAREGEAQARFPVGDDRNFVRSSGVYDERDATRILITHGIVGSETDVESASCANDAGIPITLTHPDVSIAYRDGQVISTYTGPLVNEPVCRVIVKGDGPEEERTWYVQQVCGNLLKPEGRPPVVKIPPTPTPGKEVPSKTPTNTPPVVKTPPPSATDTPMSTKTPKKPTATPISTPRNTPTSTPTDTPPKKTSTPPPPTAAPTYTPPAPCCPTAEFTPPAEGETPIRPTATPRPTRTPLPQPTQDQPDPPLPTSVDPW